MHAHPFSNWVSTSKVIMPPGGTRLWQLVSTVVMLPKELTAGKRAWGGIQVATAGDLERMSGSLLMMSVDSSWARYTPNFQTLHLCKSVVLINSHCGSFPRAIGLWLRPKASVLRLIFILQSRLSPTLFVFAASPYLHSATNVATASC